jgi:hypothetical protein
VEAAEGYVGDLLRLLSDFNLSNPTTAPVQLLVLERIPKCSALNHQHLLPTPFTAGMLLRLCALTLQQLLLPSYCLSVHSASRMPPSHLINR